MFQRYMSDHSLLRSKLNFKFLAHPKPNTLEYKVALPYVCNTHYL